ncbi:MAG: DUF547 domain-containing protein [Deltaproteobacteria bacterium]|nr:DUF547 domain-containing protein [Deltaproteobacteria bacterium]
MRIARRLFLYALLSPAATFAQQTPSTTPAASEPPVTPQAMTLRLDSVLRSVVRDGRVDYRGLRQNSAELRAYTTWLATHGPTATPTEFRSRDERMAYWLNAYNALVLQSVIDAPASMNNVMTFLPNSGFFRARSHRIDGRSLTLDHIENREIRPVFHDPRVHVALNCAARSCPPLHNRAFSSRDLSAQLTARARAYVALPASLSLDAPAHRARVSQLVQWFAEDFSANIPDCAPSTVRGPLRFFYQFASESQRAALVTACGEDGAGCTLSYVAYDWTLNAR